MTFKVRREEPPAASGTSGSKTKIAKEVAHFKKNPGVWFKVREDASSGVYQTYRRHGCETRTKTVAEGRYDVWARWVEKVDTK